MDKFMKKLLKDWYKRKHRGNGDVLDGSLLNEPRLAYDERDDGCTEFGFLSERTDLTDEEIEEMVEDMTLRIFSLYDCTGKYFTKWIHTYRNPCGLVSYVHVMGLDV